MEIITNFMQLYSVTIAVFIIAAYTEAGVLELIKKAMSNWDDKHKATASVVLAVLMSLACVLMIWKDSALAHPGTLATFPIWYALFFLLQYFADFKGGMKALINLLTATREPKPKKEKPAKPRYGKFPVDENGKPII